MPMQAKLHMNVHKQKVYSDAVLFLPVQLHQHNEKFSKVMCHLEPIRKILNASIQSMHNPNAGELHNCPPSSPTESVIDESG